MKERTWSGGFTSALVCTAHLKVLIYIEATDSTMFAAAIAWTLDDADPASHAGIGLIVPLCVVMLIALQHLQLYGYIITLPNLTLRSTLR